MLENNYPLWPEMEPYRSGTISRGEFHQIYWEECGSENGIPVLFVHGGPGSGATPADRRFFNPKRFRVVLFDQRGSGRSTPLGSIVDNAIDSCVDDIEALRESLKIDRWLLFGGSWGATLSLAYAQRYSDRCLALILRGTFLYRHQDIDAYFWNAKRLYPREWDAFCSLGGSEKWEVVTKAYYKILTDTDAVRCGIAARAWNDLDWMLGRISPPVKPSNFDTAKLVAKYRIFSHYIVNCDWQKSVDFVCAIRCIRSIDVWILHGRHDVVCPVYQAFDLDAALVNARAHLRIVENVGHSIFESSMLCAVRGALDEFLIDFHNG